MQQLPHWMLHLVLRMMGYIVSSFFGFGMHHMRRCYVVCALVSLFSFQKWGTHTPSSVEAYYLASLCVEDLDLIDFGNVAVSDAYSYSWFSYLVHSESPH